MCEHISIRRTVAAAPCGAKATMNTRIDVQGNVIKTGEQVLIDDGAEIAYIGLCYKHWQSGESRPKRPVPKGRAGKGGVIRVKAPNT